MLKVIIFLLFISGSIFAQSEVGSTAVKVPKDRNNNVTALGIVYDGVNNKYFYSPELLTVGYYGSTLITDTNTVVGNYYSVQVLEDCIIDSLVDSGRDGDSPTGLMLNAGLVIFGKNITRIKLQSGSVLAYKKQ